MLVLTRKTNESIQLHVGGENIVVHVARIEPGQVRIGIDAPHHVDILRTELAHERKKGTDDPRGA